MMLGSWPESNSKRLRTTSQMKNAGKAGFLKSREEMSRGQGQQRSVPTLQVTTVELRPLQSELGEAKARRWHKSRSSSESSGEHPKSLPESIFRVEGSFKRTTPATAPALQETGDGRPCLTVLGRGRRSPTRFPSPERPGREAAGGAAPRAGVAPPLPLPLSEPRSPHLPRRASRVEAVAGDQAVRPGPGPGVGGSVLTPHQPRRGGRGGIAPAAASPPAASPAPTRQERSPRPPSGCGGQFSGVSARGPAQQTSHSSRSPRSSVTSTSGAFLLQPPSTNQKKKNPFWGALESPRKASWGAVERRVRDGPTGWHAVLRALGRVARSAARAESRAGWAARQLARRPQPAAMCWLLLLPVIDRPAHSRRVSSEPK
ncbi:translation initiation factor IF-2-like [Panthera leo]|uniref:translation initiation factor IF-2-like n=1 Tax=Panthera leo TaxID=9689 RepID=UPI001C6A8A53|nr:translation initiation factor IF-2-like [Panthera leo]